MIVKELINLIESKPDLSKNVLIQNDFEIFTSNNSVGAISISNLLERLKFDLIGFETSLPILIIAGRDYYSNFDIIFDINGNLNFVVE